LEEFLGALLGVGDPNFMSKLKVRPCTFPFVLLVFMISISLTGIAMAILD